MLSLQLTNPVIPQFPPSNFCSQQDHRYSSANALPSLSLSNPFSPLTKQRTRNIYALHDSSNSGTGRNDGVEDYQVLTALRSNYNDIVIVDTPESRMLLLDSTHNVHSILNKHQKWTESYWDEFASLPAIIPKGPIAILGLGGGTAAHLMLDIWPSLELHGWEIDPILIDKAREFFMLSDLEKPNQAGGVLQVHIGDALSPLGNDFGRYAGIIIDLFCEGKVLSQLQEVTTWLQLNDRLIPDGRLMVNCGGIDGGPEVNGGIYPRSAYCSWVDNPTIKTLCTAFPGQLNWKRLPEGEGANYMALTGPLPDSSLWSDMVPPPLRQSVRKWKPCAPS